MPYLAEQRKRDEIDHDLAALRPWFMDEAELNYTICKLLNLFVAASPNRVPNPGFNYARINQAMGAATLAPLEWWRRCVAPYEDQKVHQNGDLSWPHV